MRFIRNWVIPILCSAFFALIGLILLGLPGVNTIFTLDGEPLADGDFTPELTKSIIDGGKKFDSYLDVYGVQLPGEPLYWSIAVLALMAFVGYRLGAILKTPKTTPT